jgi:Cu(I)/Ag(I) efflux system membrane protein CusA/SilA
MAAAAGLSVTLVPVLMGYLIRGRIPREEANPINRALIAAYRPMLEAVLSWPRLTLALAVVLVLLTAWPLSQLGGEFLPPLDEGDLLYMPSALPGLSAGKASEILQRTDRLIRQVPEVKRVFGKIGRAETATDPAPLEMVETTIQFKPRSEWRPGMTTEKLIEELDRTCGCRASRTCGFRRSATASTCSRPGSRAPWASRSRARIWVRSTASPPPSSAS